MCRPAGQGAVQVAVGAGAVHSKHWPLSERPQTTVQRAAAWAGTPTLGYGECSEWQLSEYVLGRLFAE